MGGYFKETFFFIDVGKCDLFTELKFSENLNCFLSQFPKEWFQRSVIK